MELYIIAALSFLLGYFWESIYAWCREIVDPGWSWRCPYCVHKTQFKTNRKNMTKFLRDQHLADKHADRVANT